VDNEAVAGAFTAVADLAITTGLSVYDAACLELAIRRKLPLASADEALVRAARKHKVRVLPAS